MKGNFEYFWNFLKFWEKEYVNNPSDPGGLTIWGISYKSHPKEVEMLNRLYKEGKKNQVETIARGITKKLYWDALSCDSLTDKLDIVIADTSFLQGIGVAKQVLKETARDYLSYYKVRNYTEESMFLVALLKRFDFLDDIRPALYEKFGRGWSKRILSLYDYIVSEYKEIKWD